MPPKGSQLLSRVLARDHENDGSSSSVSEDDHDLRHIAANASAGLKMEMEILKESRAREKEDKVDRGANVVDRNQFFNTQIGVGYQHKGVVRQRTAGSNGLGDTVLDMSVPVAGRKRRRQSERCAFTSESNIHEEEEEPKDSRRGKRSTKHKHKKEKKDGKDRKSSKSKKVDKNARSSKRSRRDKVSKKGTRTNGVDSNRDSEDVSPSAERSRTSRTTCEKERSHKREKSKSVGKHKNKKRSESSRSESASTHVHTHAKRRLPSLSSSSGSSSSEQYSSLGADINDGNHGPRMEDPRPETRSQEKLRRANAGANATSVKVQETLQLFRNLIHEKLLAQYDR